jgi:AraC-like DNA-binding protein/mannose-6-phosphate isomerase-like protein (cupin superfamily)
MNLNETASPPVLPKFTIRQATVRLSAARPVRAERARVLTPVAPHDHDYYEICLVVRGRGRHQSPGAIVDLVPGCVAIVPPGGVHAFPSVRELEVINLYYLSEWLLGDLHALWDQEGLIDLFLAKSLFAGRSEARLHTFQLSEQQARACEHEIGQIIDERARAAPSLMFLKSSLLKLMILLARGHRPDGGALPLPFREDVRQAIMIIEALANSGEPCDRDEVIASSGVSPDHLSRIFRRETGYSPQEYFQRRRCHRAASMLLDARKSVTSIAYELGFADAAHLSRMFGRFHGLSPRAFRQRYVPQAESSLARRAPRLSGR